jgi:4-hydroxymandelate oxidase
MTTARPSESNAYFSLEQFEAAALDTLSPAARAMIQNGAGDNSTVIRNQKAWSRWRLRPRVLVDVSARDTSTGFMGQQLALPVLIAPSGLHGLAHDEAERATACAARDAGTLMVLSMGASLPIEAVASTGARFWFQCYWGEDRSRLHELLDLAAQQGCHGICLTVDLPARPWLSAQMRDALAQIGGVKPAYMKPRTVHVDAEAKWEHDAKLTWDDLAWLKSVCKLPLALKGIMTAEDATRAIECGVNVVIVSNHGGRTSDDVPATAEVLEEIVEAVGKRVPVLVDGGIRRGTDVIKAIALGADAVLIGRPILWGLAVSGAAGGTRVLEILRYEVEAAMATIGVNRIGEIARSHLCDSRF